MDDDNAEEEVHVDNHAYMAVEDNSCMHDDEALVDNAHALCDNNGVHVHDYERDEEHAPLEPLEDEDTHYNHE